jgi:hypothetical protein
LAKEPAGLHSLETTLLRARKIAEELDDVVVLYFIDMAIAEARIKSTLTASDYKPRTGKQ